MNDAMLGYIAGLFDGEGSVYFKQTKQIRHNRKGTSTQCFSYPDGNSYD